MRITVEDGHIVITIKDQSVKLTVDQTIDLREAVNSAINKATIL